MTHKYEELWVANALAAYCRCGLWSETYPRDDRQNEMQYLDQSQDQLRDHFWDHLGEL